MSMGPLICDYNCIMEYDVYRGETPHVTIIRLKPIRWSNTIRVADHVSNRLPSYDKSLREAEEDRNFRCKQTFECHPEQKLLHFGVDSVNCIFYRAHRASMNAR